MAKKHAPPSVAAMRSALADWGVPYAGNPKAKSYRAGLARRYSYMRDALDHGARVSDLPRLVSASRGHAGTREHPTRQLAVKPAAPARRFKPPTIPTGKRPIGAVDAYVGGKDVIASQVRFQGAVSPQARVVVVVWDMRAGKFRKFFVNRRAGGASGISAGELADRLKHHKGDLRAVLEDATASADAGGAEGSDDIGGELGPIGRWELRVLNTFSQFDPAEIAV